MTVRRVHQPVMVSEVLEGLSPCSGDVFLDLTVGAGGHASRLLSGLGPRGRLIGIDRDPLILPHAEVCLRAVAQNFVLVARTSAEFGQVLDELGVPSVNGVLMDLGVSSLQLDDRARGFSFLQSGPLDMRMHAGVGETAQQLIARSSVQELTDLFASLGEEPEALRIAERIKAVGRSSPLRTTEDLAKVVAAAVPAHLQPKNHHPATRVFQALRMAVNDELGVLERTLRSLESRLAAGARVAIIAFHSLEDRIIKHWMKDAAARGVFSTISKTPLLPRPAEIERNPRSRSAKLRIATAGSRGGA